MFAEAARDGAVFVTEASGVFADFAIPAGRARKPPTAGWIVYENMIEETPDSNRFGYISDLRAARVSRPAASPVSSSKRLAFRPRGREADLLVRAGREPGPRTAYERSGYVVY